MAPATKKKKRPTKDVAGVSTKDEPVTKKRCTCTCMNGINGEKNKTTKFSGNIDASASSSKSKGPVTPRASTIKSKAAVMPWTPRSNKGQLPSLSVPRTPITRSKKQLSVQEPMKPDVVHSRRDSLTVPFVRKWSKNDELRILRGLHEHRQLHDKQPDLVVLYEKITRAGSFDNQDAGISEFKDKVRKLQSLYRRMVSMKDPKGDDHKIELFKIACNVWGDNASNAHAYGTDANANIDADDNAAPSAALNNVNAHGLADAPLGVHVGVVSSPDAPTPAAHLGMGAPATIGMPLPIERAVPSLAAPAHAMLLSSEITTATSCASSRDEDELSQWMRVVLKWGSRVAFLVAFAAFMSPGWRKGRYKEFMELGGLLPCSAINSCVVSELNAGM